MFSRYGDVRASGAIQKVLPRSGCSRRPHSALSAWSWGAQWSREEGDCELKTGEEQRPAGLAGIEASRRMDILQVPVIGPDYEGEHRSLQPVPPLLQGQLDRQQFTVANVIIPLRRGQSMGEKGTRMELVVGS